MIVEVPKYTYEDYKEWKGDWELIKGIAFALSPSPIFEHQFISLKIARELDEKLENCPKCKAVFEIDVKFDEETVVRPDVLVICYEPEDILTFAPDIIFEVISPSTIRKDENEKFYLYESEGVQYYILVYPHDKKAKVYKLVNGKYQKVGDFKDKRYLFELQECEIEFDFSKIWQ